MKTCRKCGDEKSIDEFYVHKGYKDGHMNICITCCRKASETRRKANPEAVAKYNKQYRTSNYEKCTELTKAWKEKQGDKYREKQASYMREKRKRERNNNR